jgi:hypothetical protein
MKFVDPDGRDVFIENDKDRKFYERAAARNSRVKAVFDAFAPGTGRDLAIRRGDPGVHRGTGAKRDAVTNSYYREATPDELRGAHDAAGGGATGTKAAEALLAEGQQLRSAEIVLGGTADSKDRLHELGHVEQGLLDPENAIIQAEEGASAQTYQEYIDSPSEEYADDFAVDAAKKTKEPE